jgi:hypothetical protein
MRGADTLFSLLPSLQWHLFYRIGGDSRFNKPLFDVGPNYVGMILHPRSGYLARDRGHPPDQVSSISHSSPSTHCSAESLPLIMPHSKSSQGPQLCTLVLFQQRSDSLDHCSDHCA